MAFLGSVNIIGSGITAQHLRLDVISENITNINTTRTADGETGAYRRKCVVFQAETGRNTFRDALAAARGEKLVSNAGYNRTAGVKVAGIIGYVELPNVDLVKEITDAMAASQAYNANCTAFGILKTVVNAGLQIGK